MYIVDQLNFSENAQYIFKKCIGSTAYPLLEVIKRHVMSLFYRSIVESVMSYCIIRWFGSSHKRDQHELAKIDKIAKRMGVSSKSLN